MPRQTFAIQRVGQGLAWVMGTPGGIKLNGPLTGFLANVFLQYLSWWAKILHALTPMTPFIPYFLAFIGCTTGISGIKLFCCTKYHCDIYITIIHLMSFFRVCMVQDLFARYGTVYDFACYIYHSWHILLVGCLGGRGIISRRRGVISLVCPTTYYQYREQARS